MVNYFNLNRQMERFLLYDRPCVETKFPSSSENGELIGYIVDDFKKKEERFVRLSELEKKADK